MKRKKIVPLIILISITLLILFFLEHLVSFFQDLLDNQ